MPYLDIGPIPPPRTTAAPSGTPTRRLDPRLAAKAGCLLALVLLLFVAVVLAVGGVVLWWHSRTPGPGPSPAHGVQLGRDFRGPLCEALAEAFDADADALERKDPVTKADEALKETFAKARKQLFRDGPSQAFDAIVPAGKEPEDDGKRAEFARLHRDFARGLRTKP